jgi:glycosyltransferase involved in cell wall biosynthesis
MGALYEIDGAAQIMMSYVLNCRQVNCLPRVAFVHPFSRKNQYYKRMNAKGIAMFSLTHHYFYYMLRAARASINIYRKVTGRGERLSWENALERFLCAYIKFHKIDLVHVLRSDPAMPIAVRAAYRAGRPAIYHEMGAPRFIVDTDSYFQNLSKSLPLCSSVAALSEALSGMMEKCVPSWMRSYAIPLIYEEDQVWQSVERVARDNVVIGFVGRFDPLKGAVDLVEAFAKAMPAMLVSTKLLLAGTGPEADKIISTARRLGCEDWVEIRAPYQGEKGKAEFYKSIDLLALPSYTEGTPNCVIEAMLFELPVIAYSVGGVPDIISCECGKLIEKGDIASLASAITELVNDKTKRVMMGYAARQRAKKAFSKESVLPILRRTYDETIASHGQRDYSRL